MDAVRGIGFDLDHTLAIDNHLERVAFLRLLDVLLGEGGRGAGTLADEIESIDELLARQRRGDFSIDDAVRRFVAGRDLRPAQAHVDFFRRRALEMVDEFVVPLPGVKPVLEVLQRRGIALAVLTNGWTPLQTRKAQRAGFGGPVLVSDEIGERKPARAAFELLLCALGTDSSLTWYVGDDPRRDVAGAQAAGMEGIWLNWERKTYPGDVRPPRHTIAAFGELIDLVAMPAAAP